MRAAPDLWRRSWAQSSPIAARRSENDCSLHHDQIAQLIAKYYFILT
jgi:hypothetical protein